MKYATARTAKAIVWVVIAGLGARGKGHVGLCKAARAFGYPERFLLLAVRSPKMLNGLSFHEIDSWGSIMKSNSNKQQQTATLVPKVTDKFW
jgi:hypothetical protein